MQAVLYDGKTARAHAVEVEFSNAGLSIINTAGVATLVPLAVLRSGDKAARLALHRLDLPDWRLVPDAPPPADWLRKISRIGTLSRRDLGRYTGAALATIAVVVGLWLFGDTVLEATAPLVPSRVLVSLGDGLVHDLGGRRCTAPAGTMALARLQQRLAPGRADAIRIIVIETAAVNAFAVPGSRVVIFSGLIDKARTPDEVAGVLAHEMTHVALRHPTKALLRQMGVSLLARALGGDVGGAADVAVLLNGSRRAETAADKGAVDLLGKAHVSVRGAHDFFLRMHDEDRRKVKDSTRQMLDRLGDFAATHPGDSERAAMVAAAAPQGSMAAPALSPADWQALRSICTVTAAN